MTDRWTAETEELGTAALWRFGHLGAELDDAVRSDEPAAVAFTKGAVRAVLTALADAGLLLAPSGDTRQDVGHWSPNRGYVYACGDGGVGPEAHGPEYGRGSCETPISHTSTVTSWPDGSRHYGPWVAVSEP